MRVMTIQTPVVRSRAFICPHCVAPASATVKGIAIWDGRNAEGEPIEPPLEYAFVQCASCQGVAIEMREDYGRGFEADEPAFLYPAPHRLSNDVPHGLRQEWAEARDCFDAKAYKATVVMVRRTLEGTCKEEGVAERSLYASLKKMETQGKIDGMLADWANLLRVVGNEGAHYTGNAVSREDAEDALSFAEALLDHIYVLRKRFDEFKQRRSPSVTAETGDTKKR
jgi:hypothetical protein